MKERDFTLSGIYLGVRVGEEEERGMALIAIKDARSSLHHIGTMQPGDRVVVTIAKVKP